MSDLRCRTAALFAIGLSVGLLAGVEHTQADTFGASLFEPYPTFNFSSPAFQLAALARVEPRQYTPAYKSAEPFDVEISTLVKGGLQDKWASVKKRLPRESRVLMRCRTNAATCPPAAQRFLAIIDKALTRDGWARIAEINRSINLNIRPVDDMTQYGVADLWATPLMLFASNAGDCEDYAIAKYVGLQQIGIADDDLRLIVVHDRAANEDHAATAVRFDGRWLILDNRALTIREDVDIAEFDPLYVIDSEGAKKATTIMASKSRGPQTGEPIAVDMRYSFGGHSRPPLL